MHEEYRDVLLIRGLAAVWSQGVRTLNVRPPTNKRRVLDSDSAEICYQMLCGPIDLKEVIERIEDAPPDDDQVADTGGKGGETTENARRRHRRDDKDRAKKKALRILLALHECGLVEQVAPESEEFLSDTKGEKQVFCATDKLRELFRAVIRPEVHKVLERLDLCYAGGKENNDETEDGLRDSGSGGGRFDDPDGTAAGDGTHRQSRPEPDDARQ